MGNLPERAVDARVIKTQQRLKAAVLELSAVSAVEDITVTELCRRAEVDRATFYRHAQSPAELLRSALVDELDGLRAVFLVGASGAPTDFRQLWVDAARGTIDHIKRFEQVYEVGFAATSDGSLQNLFSRHIADSMSALLRSHRELLPAVAWEHEDFMVDALSSGLAYSLTALLRAWVTSVHRDEKAYVLAVLKSLPSWMVGDDSASVLSPSGNDVLPDTHEKKDGNTE